MYPRTAVLLLLSAGLAGCGGPSRGAISPSESLAAGLAAATGRGAPVDFVRAARLFEGACEGGSAEGCAYLAALIKEGRGVPPDPPRAAALSARACDGGHLASCRDLAALLERGAGVPRDVARAAQLPQR